jgi:hypothetical protein
MTEMSTFIRTACHDAPVFQVLENREAEVCPVRCVVCRAEAGTPGLEDVSDERREALEWRWFHQEIAWTANNA